MPYYPKTKIVTDLFTNSGQFIKASTYEPYSGPYYELSNGKTYIGPNPQANRFPEEILNLATIGEPVKDTTLTSEIVSVRTRGASVSEYVGGLKETVQSKIVPTPYYPQPTENDYSIGYFTRYFAKKINEYAFVEISKKTYENFVNKNSAYLWEMYYVTELPWQITGQVEKVYKTNKHVVELEERKKFGKLSQFLKNDYIKFYKK